MQPFQPDPFAYKTWRDYRERQRLVQFKSLPPKPPWRRNVDRPVWQRWVLWFIDVMLP